MGKNMVYNYTPAYYSSFQDTVTSFCKSVLPFSFKTSSSSTKRLAHVSYEQTLAKQQSENLKWQQDMFHKMLKLIALHKEGILPQTQVSDFKTNLLDTVITSPLDYEQPAIIKDKLVFLQELYYANCITEDEYHASKRPLLQRLAVQGEEISCKDLVVSSAATNSNLGSDLEWSVVELNDDTTQDSKNSAKHRSPMKQIKGVFSKIASNSSAHKSGKNKSSRTEQPVFSVTPREELILMTESSPPRPSLKEESSSKGKKSWGFRKWKKRSLEDEPYNSATAERTEDAGTNCKTLPDLIYEGPETKIIKKKIHPDSVAYDSFAGKNQVNEMESQKKIDPPPSWKADFDQENNENRSPNVRDNNDTFTSIDLGNDDKDTSIVEKNAKDDDGHGRKEWFTNNPFLNGDDFREDSPFYKNHH